MTSETFRRLLLWTAGLSLAAYVLLAGLSGTLLQPATVLDLHIPQTLTGRTTAVLGLVMVVSFPGLLLSLALPSQTTKPVTDVLLEALGLSTGAHIVNLSIAKAVGIPISPGTLIGLGLLEVAAAWLWAYHRGTFTAPPPPSSGEWAGLLTAILLPTYLVGTHASFVVRHLGDYFYEEGWLEDADQAKKEIEGVTIERSQNWEPVQAFEYRIMRLRSMSAPETLVLRTPGFRNVTLRFLWQGPVGSRLQVVCEDKRAEARVDRAPVELKDEGATLRYLDSGIDSVAIQIPVRSSRQCVLTPVLRPGQHGTLLDLSGCPAEVLYDTDALGGWKPIHYYQILNIAENVAWSRQLFDGLWTTKNQPPLWSYVYSSTNLYVGDGLWAINLFFFLLVGLTAYLVWAIVLLERPDATLWLLSLVVLIGISHAHIMVEPGSTNFPDNLYALAMVASLYLLLRGRRTAFAVAGVATTLLRYSGSGAILLMGALAAWFRRAQKRRMVQCVAGWALAMGIVSAGFLVVAVITGSLHEWLDVLYFETFPEHFHGNYDLVELLRRPPAFYWVLLKVTGFMPAFWLLLRGTTPKLAAALTLGYTAMLCLVDHFPSHYFVPPMYLIAIATTGTLASLRGWKQWTLAAMCLVGLVWGLQQPL